MAAIAIADCTVSIKSVGGQKIASIVTPATADGGDTIDVSSLFSNGCFALMTNTTDKTSLSENVFGTTITIPAAGAGNEARTILAIGW